MRIGYPCSNRSLDVSAARTFRLASYTPERLIETVEANLLALRTILEWNVGHGILFFRISSTTVPFVSHPIMDVDWQRIFAPTLAEFGELINAYDMRINMHPGQYTLLNAPKPEVVQQSIAELRYHAELLDLLGLDHTHKIQIHTGGVYGDKVAASERFVETYAALPEQIRRRLVIENDERQYSLRDNLYIHERTGTPLLFDVFHHSIFNNGETLEEALDLVIPTWKGQGRAMVDYSSQDAAKQAGAHTAAIDLDGFATVLPELLARDPDLTLEIKDKEASVLRAMEYVDEWSSSRVGVG
jgi:UV DNA damage endonuclease